MERENNWSNITLEEIRSILYASNEGEAQKIIVQMQQDKRKGTQIIIAQYKKWLEKEHIEKERIHKLWQLERNLKTAGFKFIAGIDEVGRGPLAGPVVAACVILPHELELPGLNDSKQIVAKERKILSEIIKRKAVAWGIGVVDHQEVDRINILQATKKAMVEAVKLIGQQPDYLLIDALKIPVAIPQDAVVHGDTLSASIAAASIVAKTYRDSLMEMMDVLYPEYGFKEHKGYGTARHREALVRYGSCPIHRTSFLQNII
ncbi:MAG: ribonuclease HII [Firmicutes bacterium HGW-Firmicutes-12]|nr:MAG: ribonuclease HII [Firmicutes bacterium HGW-Firmicutes-12]